MEKNNSKIGIAEAMRIYNGKDPVKQTLCLWGILTLVFYAFYIFARIVTGFAIGDFWNTPDNSSDNFDFYDGVCRSVFVSLMCYATTTGTLLVHFQEFYKNSAGGKYFRSVRGGFDTYSKMKTGTLISCICGMLLFVTVVFLVNTVLHLVYHGLAVCVTVFLVSLLGIAASKLICMIKIQAVRTMIYIITINLYSIVSSCILETTECRFSIAHVVILILAVILIAITHLGTIRNFRKNHWYV